jgi:2-dehydro-3-deoxyphosphogluconate aldolase/(4S)-4-hydroxy-2-oxoglutarate aldolase
MTVVDADLGGLGASREAGPVERIGELGLVPVVEIDEPGHAEPLMDALVSAGLPCAEITLRTDAAVRALRTARAAQPGALIGAGTVLTPDQVDAAIDAGADFVVAPGFGARVVDRCLAREIPVLPGVSTPTEIQMALDRSLGVLKFFPAEAVGGVPYLRAISAPFRGVRFIPTGGIDPANLEDYLRLPTVLACGGSWMVRRQLIADRDFATIARLAREALEIVARVRAAAQA